jgi:hypothetical protein
MLEAMQEQRVTNLLTNSIFAKPVTLISSNVCRRANKQTKT